MPPLTRDSQNVSRHCQMSPGGQNLPWWNAVTMWHETKSLSTHIVYNIQWTIRKCQMGSWELSITGVVDPSTWKGWLALGVREIRSQRGEKRRVLTCNLADSCFWELGRGPLWEAVTLPATPEMRTDFCFCHLSFHSMFAVLTLLTP